jgi:hypothetical protein
VQNTAKPQAKTHFSAEKDERKFTNSRVIIAAAATPLLQL